MVRRVVRYCRYALSTGKASVYWVRFFVKLYHLTLPSNMVFAEVEAFLLHLANDRIVFPSTHGQALSALLFLYREVWKIDLPWLRAIKQPKPAERVPVALTVDEVRQILWRMDGASCLVAQALYVTGIRIIEALLLLIKDVELNRGVIIVHEEKSTKDRVVT